MGLKELVDNSKAIIFDLDGTLIDSMNVWSDIDKEFFKMHDLPFEEDYQKEIGHKGLKEIAAYTKTRYNLKESEDEIVTIWLDMAKEAYAYKIPLKEGVKSFLEYLQSKNIKMGIATSNSLELTELVLKHHDIYKYFSKVVTVNELKTNKGSPDIYLHISDSFGLVPSECIVFEDLLTGIKTAKKAGYKVVGVKEISSLDKEKEIREIADLYISNYNL
ncbi:MAG: HAD family phosphatase [Mollicutes bacterium]|nr:HAD family phosphatase [Mollicutes bacterium]